MRTDTFAKVGRLAALAAALVALFALFLLAVRPWAKQWGATAEEAHALLPGDALIEPARQSTRAITIAAPAERVWPWLLQLGQDRGGFYSYTLLENLVGTDMHNLGVLRPELQHWQVGDKLWLYPPSKLGGAGHAVLEVLAPGHALVFGTRRVGVVSGSAYDGSWAFVLEPADAHNTRLLVRGRAREPATVLQRAFEALVFEPLHFMMERKMMTGIKACAEGHTGSWLEDALELVVYGACFVLFCAAGVQLVRWPSARRWAWVILGTGLAFQWLTFVQPHWVVGLVLVGMLALLFEFAEQP